MNRPPSTLSVRAIASTDRVALDAWHGLAARSTVFQTPEWVLPYYPRAELLGVFDGPRLVGVAPIEIERRKDGLRYVRLCGGDYEDLVAAEGQEDCVLGAVVSYLGARRDWDLMDFRGLSPRGVVCTAIARGWRAAGFTTMSAEHQRYSYIDLNTRWEVYAKSRSKKMAWQLRNNERRRNEDFGQRVWLADERTLDEDLDTLFDLHTKRWNARGFPGSYSTDEERCRMREACRGFLARGNLWLYTMALGETRAASLLVFSNGRRLYHQTGGFDESFKKYAPANGLIMRCIKDGIDAGLEAFDFMKGNEGYKSDWADGETVTQRLVIARRRLRPWLALKVFQHQPAVKAWLKARRRR